MSQQYTPAASMRTLMQALTLASGFLNNITWRLFQQAISPSPLITIGSFVEANFPGYAPIVVSVYGLPWSDPVGNGYETGQQLQFTCNAGGGGQNIYGYFVTTGSGAGETVLFYEQWDNYIPIAGPGDAVLLQSTYGLPGPITVAGVGP